MDQHFCTACGHQLGSGDFFCTACGTRIEDGPTVDPTSARAASPVPPPSPASSVPPPPPVLPPDPTVVRRAVPHQPPHQPPHHPPRRRRSRAAFWGWIAAVAVLVAVVSFALGTLVTHDGDNGDRADQAGNDTAQSGPTTSGSSPSRKPTTGPSRDPQALAQARALHSLIDHSAADKHRIAVAAAQLQSCSHVRQGIQAFEDAAASRDQLVDNAAELQVGLLPGGGAAIASFSKALRASAAADRAYVAYGQKRHKVPSGKRRHHHRPMKCTGGKKLEQRAVQLSAASHAAKQQTAKEWNLIADQFKLPKVVWTSL